MEYRPGRGIIVWRSVIVALMLVVALLAVAVVALFNANRDAIETNHEAIKRSEEALAQSRALDCRIGGFLVGFPVVKQPGTSEADFQKGVQKALDFLHALRAENCNGLGRVTTAKINAQTKALHKVVPKGGGGSTGNPHSPGSLSGGGPSSAPPPSPPVTPPTTPAPPPTSTTTPTTPMPPNVVHRLICMLNRLGIKVCVRR